MVQEEKAHSSDEQSRLESSLLLLQQQLGALQDELTARPQLEEVTR